MLINEGRLHWIPSTLQSSPRPAAIASPATLHQEMPWQCQTVVAGSFKSRSRPRVLQPAGQEPSVPLLDSTQGQTRLLPTTRSLVACLQASSLKDSRPQGLRAPRTQGLKASRPQGLIRHRRGVVAHLGKGGTCPKAGVAPGWLSSPIYGPSSPSRPQQPQQPVRFKRPRDRERRKSR